MPIKEIACLGSGKSLPADNEYELQHEKQLLFIVYYKAIHLSPIMKKLPSIAMERLYCLLVTAFLLLSQLLVISFAFIIILDAVDIMLCIHTILSQANAIVACALNIMLDAFDILFCIHTVIS